MENSIRIVADYKENEIIEYCEQRPADYAMYAWVYNKCSNCYNIKRSIVSMSCSH
jgi:hypothetical protein